jgi:hypothetical protein
MSAFDATIRVGEAGTEAIPSEDGKLYEGQLVLGLLTVVPVGPQQLLPVPFGTVRVPLNKKSCGSLIESLQELYDSLEERSNIEVATNLSAVEAAAQRAQEATQTFTGGR